MKKFRIIITALIMNICIICNFSVVGAYSTESKDFINDKIDSLIVENITVEGYENRHINHASIEIILEAAGKSNNPLELYIQTLSLLGLENNVIASFPKEDIFNMFQNSRSITISTVYIKTMADERTVMNREACLKEANEQEEYNNNILFNNFLYDISNDDKILENNYTDINESSTLANAEYMKIDTICIYQNGSEKGWYEFYGIYTWLTTPANRLEDGFSLYASNFAWSPSTNDFYSTFSYIKREFYGDMGGNIDITDEQITQTKTTQDRNIKPDGLFYTWDLPSDVIRNGWTSRHDTLYRDFLFTIKGKARVSYPNLQYVFNLYTRYEHLASYFIIKPSFGWEIGHQPGFTFTGGWSPVIEIYTSYNYNVYNP